MQRFVCFSDGAPSHLAAKQTFGEVFCLSFFLVSSILPCQSWLLSDWISCWVLQTCAVVLTLPKPFWSYKPTGTLFVLLFFAWLYQQFTLLYEWWRTREVMHSTCEPFCWVIGGDVHFQVAWIRRTYCLMRVNNHHSCLFEFRRCLQCLSLFLGRLVFALVPAWFWCQISLQIQALEKASGILGCDLWCGIASRRM